MTHDELRKLETKRRKALWVLAKYIPGDSKAADALAILDDLEIQERNCKLTTDKPLELTEVRDFVPVQHHHCIDIIFEHMQDELSTSIDIVDNPPTWGPWCE